MRLTKLARLKWTSSAPALSSGMLINVQIDFESVDVFDIKSYLDDPTSNGTWYQQNTTGDIPSPRIDFCTVSISAPDNSSHHIYLYGGYDPITNSSYDDVVVLTMPSFEWTTVWPQGESPRYGHTCHVAGKRQMITVGGNVTNRAGCDWERKGVAVLDMTTIGWGSVFRSNVSDFQVPQKVLGATRGTADGSATISEPVTGWSDQALRDVFWTSRWTVPSTWTSSSSKSKTNVGAIAGGVVGGVVGLVLIGLALFFWNRKRRKARAPAELSGDEVQRELDDEKKKYELQGVNENDPAELPSPDPVELNAPREFVEADRDTATNAAELPGTNVAAGGVHGVPIVRTPGDDLPEPPVYTTGLRRRGSAGSGGSSGRGAQETQHETRQEYFPTPGEELPKETEEEKNEEHFQTLAEEVPTKPPDGETPDTEHKDGATKDVRERDPR